MLEICLRAMFKSLSYDVSREIILMDNSFDDMASVVVRRYSMKFRLEKRYCKKYKAAALSDVVVRYSRGKQ